MKVAEFIVARLQALGVDTCFMVTGGGAMHLNDAIGGAQGLTRVYCHHEQSCSFAADAYARVAKKPALVNVTAGPGGINALNCVFGAFTDSLPMIVVSGQVKRETMREFNPVAGLRQLGDQEVDIVAMAKPITKWVQLVRSENDVPDLVDQAFLEATTGRPGPVWLDVPVDVQGTVLPAALEARVTSPLKPAAPAAAADAKVCEGIIAQIAAAKRPVILAGTGVAVSATEEALLALVETLQVPLATAWAHDIFPNEHALYAGRPGTIGTRDGNFIVQNADLLVVLGSRLNIRQTSYNWKSFARSAKKIWVDIDSAELSKPFVTAEQKIVADLRTFLPQLAIAAKSHTPSHSAWVAWCQGIREKYRPKVNDYPVSAERINAYHFFFELFTHVAPGDLVVCGDATATIVPYQVGVLKKGMRLISNSGSASMGFDIPGALGAITARPNARVICLAGDGSGMMNLQELQTLRATGANVKVFILNNDGYLSIKQTQRNFFGREAGASSSSGLTFPNFVAVGRAFGFENAIGLTGTGWQAALSKVMNESGPSFCDVELDLVQEFEPRLKSKMLNGTITTPELEDMHPFLPESEVRAVRESALKISRSPPV